MFSSLKKIICAAMAAIGLFSCSKSKYVWKTEEEYYNLPKWDEHVAAFKKVNMAPHTAKLFIGDSITEGFDLQKAFGDNTVVNMGIGGDFTSGVLMRMGIAKKLQPAKVFLMIGINDITNGTPQEVIHERYAKIISLLKKDCPSATIYVQSTLPTRAVGGSPEASIAYNMEVKALNNFLRNQCALHHLTFVDLHALFEEDGMLNEDYTYDGIHISNDGYKVWAEAITDFVLN